MADGCPFRGCRNQCVYSNLTPTPKPPCPLSDRAGTRIRQSSKIRNAKRKWQTFGYSIHPSDTLFRAHTVARCPSFARPCMYVCVCVYVCTWGWFVSDVVFDARDSVHSRDVVLNSTVEAHGFVFRSPVSQQLQSKGDPGWTCNTA